MGQSLNQIESRSSVNHHPFSREIIAGFRLDALARPFGRDIGAPGPRPLVAPDLADRPRGARCRGTASSGCSDRSTTSGTAPQLRVVTHGLVHRSNDVTRANVAGTRGRWCMQTRLQLTGTGEVPEVRVMLGAEDRAKAIERLARRWWTWQWNQAVTEEQSSEDGQSCEHHVRPANRATRVA